ncbi:hypothetical protein D3C72_1193580 [compost metagenome]
MVVVVAGDCDVDGRAQVLGQRADDVGRQVGAVVADEGGGERPLEHWIGTARQVDGDRRIGLVHRQDEAVAGYALTFAQGLFQRLPQSDGAVLDGVVRVGVQVALARQSDREPAVRRHLFDHVVEEADAGVDRHRPGAVQIDGADDAGLFRIAHGLPDAGAAHLRRGGPKRHQQPVVDLGLQRHRQAHPLSGRIGVKAEAAQVFDQGDGIGRTGDDHRPGPGLQRHQPRQGLGDAGALAAHAVDALGGLDHPRGVQSLRRQPHRDLGQGVGLHHAGQSGQGLRLRHGCAHACSSQAIGQRQAAQHDQIGVILHDRRSRGRFGEFDQSLVDHQQGRGHALGHLSHRLGRAQGADHHGGDLGLTLRTGVERRQPLIGFGVRRLNLQAVTRSQAPDQLQPVRQAAHRQHLIGGDSVESGQPRSQRGRIGRIAVQTFAA